VDADAEQIGGACADTYFQSVNVSGTWANLKPEAKTFASFKGFAFKAGEKHDPNDRMWISLGPLSLKVVHGLTNDGIQYLNVLVRNMRFVGYVVGGLLGEDDHAAAEKPSKKCMSVRSLLDV